MYFIEFLVGFFSTKLIYEPTVKSRNFIIKIKLVKGHRKLVLNAAKNFDNGKKMLLKLLTVMLNDADSFDNDKKIMKTSTFRLFFIR